MVLRAISHAYTVYVHTYFLFFLFVPDIMISADSLLFTGKNFIGNPLGAVMDISTDSRTVKYVQILLLIIFLRRIALHNLFWNCVKKYFGVFQPFVVSKL